MNKGVFVWNHHPNTAFDKDSRAKECIARSLVYPGLQLDGTDTTQSPAYEQLFRRQVLSPNFYLVEKAERLLESLIEGQYSKKAP